MKEVDRSVDGGSSIEFSHLPLILLLHPAAFSPHNPIGLGRRITILILLSHLGPLILALLHPPSISLQLGPPELHLLIPRHVIHELEKP